MDPNQHTNPEPPESNPVLPPAPEPTFSHNSSQPPVPQPAPPAAPQTQPNPTNAPDSSAIPHDHNNAGLIVLQWLTYAFWGWTVLAMSILTATVLASYIGDAETGSFTPYGTAAVLVLLPISIICDHFYSKKEPQKKTGAASIVMVIHAVLFALFGIGAVIALVFSIVTLLTSSTDKSANYAFLLSSLIIAILYGAVFLRTLNPAKMPFVRRFFIIFMTVVVGLISLFGILGPFAKERATRDDRLIENNLNSLKSSLDSYAVQNGELPSDLSSLDLDGDTEQLVSRQLVRYTANTKQPTTKTVGSRTASTQTTYYYEICVTYAQESKNRYGYRSRSQSADGYETYINSSDHKAGEECYKLASDPYAY